MSLLATIYHDEGPLSRGNIRRFGDKLRALRTGQGLTLKQLSQSLGLASHSYLCELEAGKKTPTAELVVQLSELFGTTTDSLLLDDQELPQ
jgi:transcriptional regulator with XRE-family HTH domain